MNSKPTCTEGTREHVNQQFIFLGRASLITGTIYKVLNNFFLLHICKILYLVYSLYLVTCDVRHDGSLEFMMKTCVQRFTGLTFCSLPTPESASSKDAGCHITLFTTWSPLFGLWFTIINYLLLICEKWGYLWIRGWDRFHTLHLLHLHSQMDSFTNSQ